jgi:hypothetical protein
MYAAQAMLRNVLCSAACDRVNGCTADRAWKHAFICLGCADIALLWCAVDCPSCLQATEFERMQWTVLNSAVSLMGYWCAAALVDKKW